MQKSETQAETSDPGNPSLSTNKLEAGNNESQDKFVNKHPIFERKTKVVGNDSFLKQIFS